MKIAFSGAHRTGKTTLAEVLSIRHEYVMKHQNISELFKNKSFAELESERGYVGWQYAKTRQTTILHHVAQNIINAEQRTFFDRSTLDVFAYGDYYNGRRVEELFHGTENPTRALMQIADEHAALQQGAIDRFVLQDFTFIIQPAIAFEHDPKKAEIESQEEINETIIWAAETYLPANRYFVMPREITDLNERVAVCEDVLRVKKIIK